MVNCYNSGASDRSPYLVFVFLMNPNLPYITLLIIGSWKSVYNNNKKRWSQY